MERTLTVLRQSLNGDIYVFLQNAEVCQRFLRDADSEGFLIGQDRSTMHPHAMVMALHDGTINYVGANGMTRFQCGDTDDFHRVDYERYVSGTEDYRYRETETA